MRVLSWAFGIFLAGAGSAFALSPKGLVDQAGREVWPSAFEAEQTDSSFEAPFTGPSEATLPKAALPGAEGAPALASSPRVSVKPLLPATATPVEAALDSPSSREGVEVRVYKRGQKGYRATPQMVINGRLVPAQTFVLLQNGRTFVSLDPAFLRLMNLRLVRDFRAGRQSAFLLRGSQWLKFTEGVDRLVYNQMEVRQKGTDTPFRFSGRLMVPFRDVAEVFGYQVGWDSLAKKVVAFA